MNSITSLGSVLIALFLTSGANVLHAADTQGQSAFRSEVIDPGFVVSDVKKAVQFYTEAIGFKEVPGFSVPGAWTKDVGLTDGKTLTIRVLVLGEGKNATKLKLMEVTDAKPEKDNNKYITSQLGMRYLAIQVADMDQAMARLKKAGVTPVTKGGMVELPEGLPRGIWLSLVKDPDGNMMELVGPRPNATK